MAIKELERKENVTRRQSLNIRHKLAIKADKLGARLVGFALAETEIDQHGQRVQIEMSSAQVKAAEVILNRTVPILQQVDSTIVDNRETGATEGEILDRLAVWLTRNPALLDALRAKGVTVDAQPTQATLTADTSEPSPAPSPADTSQPEPPQAQRDTSESVPGDGKAVGDSQD